MRLFQNPFKWYHNNYHKFIHCKMETSEVILSRTLFEEIQKDHPDSSKFNVLFTKIRDHKNMNLQYAMFFNPEWSKHGTSGDGIMTVPVTLGKKGHIGFQTIQPTVAEIFAMYGKNESELDLVVEKKIIFDEPYYIIRR